MNQKTPQRRRHERFPFHNSVILVLNDGREISGIADNMGYGGASMTVTGTSPEIQQGTQGKLKVVFFGRPTDYPCTVVTANGLQLGLKIHRTEYEGAPETILSIPE